MSEPSIVLFDFDGTIADTHTPFINIVNRLADEFGYPTATPAEIQELQGLSAQEIIRRSKISVFKIPLVLRRVKRELYKEMRDVGAIAGMETALQTLHEQGYKLGIVTSNWIENVRLFLEVQQLADCFEWVYASSTLFGKHRRLKRLIQQNQFSPQQVIYVGDEVRDIEAARKSDIAIISVTWGFNTSEILAAYQPDALISEVTQLVPIVHQILPRQAV